MDSQREPQTLQSRRGRQIPPVKTQLTSEALRSHRPRPAKDHTTVHPDRRVPLSPAVKRQSSIKGFKNLFKSARDPNSTFSLPVVDESQTAANCSTPISAPPLSANTHTTSKTETARSTPVPPSSTQLSKDKTQRNLSKKPKEKPPRTITSWDPPPLFKAYPQAVKHTSLLAPKLPSDTILRLNGRRGSTATEESVEGDDSENHDSDKKQKKKDKKESRRLSVSINKGEWSQKIFVLVTSGFLLQYTGDGNFDRLPEKMMQLNKDSVAFASDAIPGKHWVVQISQALDDETVAPERPKGLFSRLGFQSSNARRVSKSFLLVLENPEDMNAWLVVLRREIDALGGNKYAETPMSAKFVQNKPSLKYLKKRDSLRTLSTRPETGTTATGSVTSPITKEVTQYDHKKANETPSATSTKRQSMPTRSSVDAPSLSTLATTTDLDRLRESSRFSYVSAGTRTIPSSRGSSPGNSPSRANFTVSRRPNLDPCAAFRGTSSNTLAPPSSAGRQAVQGRSPVQAEPKLQDPPRSVPSPQPSSPPVSRNGSPSAPNFSVPSFSKRFSMPSTSPKLPPPTSDPTSRSQQPSPIPGRLSSQGTDGSSTSGSDLIHDHNNSRPCSTALSEESDTSLPTSSDGPIRTPSIRSNSSAGGRVRPKRGSTRENAIRNFRSSHPPLSSIALPELSPLIDEFPTPGTGSTRSPHESTLLEDSERSKLSPKSTHSRHSMRAQVQPQHSTPPPAPAAAPQSPPPSKAPATNKARSGSLYFCPQSQPNMAPVAESHHSPNGPSSPQNKSSQKKSKRLSARKSLPEFPYGPPIAPPPDCPLPEVPPIVVSQFQASSRQTGSPSGGGNGNSSTRSTRRGTGGGGRKSYPVEPRVQPKYDNILNNLEDDSNSDENNNAPNVF
ncbi:hypothetical protein FQN54_004162 [Arachnomyces sp. PD_36]|nr:hypothetical protein FQN54_004162 [Arachnomyces sp. PD_36]